MEESLMDFNANKTKDVSYGEDAVQTLKWNEHIRRRPGMYIGKLGDGTSPDDGIYILIKEVIDNSIDEYMMGYGNAIEVALEQCTVTIRDYGRGVPLGSVVDVASKINTGAKYSSEAFTKSVGLNGVGIKAVNALSSLFEIRSVRDGKSRRARFSGGELLEDSWEDGVNERNGTYVSFIPDGQVFGEYSFNSDYIQAMLKNYTYLNSGLPIYFNGVKFISKNGLLDLLNNNLSEEPRYEPIHLKGYDIELAFTHGNGYNESYYSFVNGQYTPQGGTHQSAFREALVKTIKEFFRKDYDPADIRTAIIAAVSIKVEEPIFESQTKTKLGSKDMDSKGTVTVRGYIVDFVKEHLDNFLHKNPIIADAINRRIQESEKERKAISGVRKKAREIAKKVSLHNRKLRDCRSHLNTSSKNAEDTMIFITEGDSASGSITKSRDVNTQAVFSLKGKPLNTYGLTKKVIYQNEEFNLLQAALNIEEDMDNLRYNKVIIATDADVDGMHIRLLLITFFLQFFPDIIHRGHLYILETPLFRVRNKKETIYCYNDTEKEKAIATLKNSIEITRFKGLGEISPDEFRNFIGEDMRLERVRLTKDDPIPDILEFYMGKNTGDRQDFIINNLRIEEDVVENA